MVLLDVIDANWSGITCLDQFNPPWRVSREALHAAASCGNWPIVVSLLTKHEDLANAADLIARNNYTPLHWAAQLGAPVAVIEQLVSLGAWRTVLNDRRERPVDTAKRMGRENLIKCLSPNYRHEVPPEVLLRIQEHFHAVIQDQIAQALPDHGLRFPELAPLLELISPIMGFSVPGMYGGFRYGFTATGHEAVLFSESSSRVIEGLGKRYEISSAGARWWLKDSKGQPP